jgi:two-component system, cell cycle sensor histidine kinase and response regulator CckA
MDIVKKSSTILIVDDDCSSRMLVSEILEGANVVIIECGCGKDALDLFERYQKDINMVILDIKLNDCNGWELLQQFKVMKPDAGVMVVSAIIPEELASCCKAAGVNLFLSKPFDINEFLELITSNL